MKEGVQSSTLRSYYCGIKSVLKEDGYVVDDDKVLLNTLAKACKLKNDHVITRLPIQCKLLEILLFEVQRLFADQSYLEILYKAIFSHAYYGLFRIGELTKSKHAIKATNVHIASNKEKMLFVLHSSKNPW